MTIKVDEEFSDWETYYKNNEVTKMPWYDKNLDHDLENEIKTRNVTFVVAMLTIDIDDNAQL